MKRFNASIIKGASKMLKNFLRSQPPAAGVSPEYLVVGLGNPGPKYEYSRHNAGFLCVDVFSNNLGKKFDRLKFKSLMGDVMIAGHRCIVMKPQTMMNNSGIAVSEAANFYKIPPEKVLVIFDDTSLSCGSLRIRRKGSDGGHNGIKSIIYHLNSDNFPRIKLGIGERPNPDFDLADWVLSSFSKNELALLRETCQKANEAAELIVGGEIETAMNKFN